jgi:hypothetical protein
LARLSPHPLFPCSAVTSIAAQVARGAGDLLSLRFMIEGGATTLRIPPLATPRYVHGLWQHTCVEAFIATDAATSAYHEYNFSPSGEWAAYSFKTYRDGKTRDDAALAPAIEVRRRAAGLDITATIHLERLSFELADSELQLGLTAILESTDGSLSYWALSHPAEHPDFHHPASRTLRLERPGRSRTGASSS